jgi:hypothetical protein
MPSTTLNLAPAVRAETSTTPTTSQIEVTILRWPQQEDLRRWLAHRHLPRILLVDPEVQPPEVSDDLEDWVRGDLDPIDQAARCRVLSQRAHDLNAQLPFLDPDGLLRHDGRWVAIPEGQIEMVRLLLDRLNRVVPIELITAAYEATGGSGHPNTIRTAISRLGGRMRELHLELVTVRGRGVLLPTSPPADR